MSLDSFCYKNEHKPERAFVAERTYHGKYRKERAATKGYVQASFLFKGPRRRRGRHHWQRTTEHWNTRSDPCPRTGNGEFLRDERRYCHSQVFVCRRDSRNRFVAT